VQVQRVVPASHQQGLADGGGRLLSGDGAGARVQAAAADARQDRAGGYDQDLAACLSLAGDLLGQVADAADIEAGGTAQDAAADLDQQASGPGQRRGTGLGALDDVFRGESSCRQAPMAAARSGIRPDRI
jgi:hypothetical protein